MTGVKEEVYFRLAPYFRKEIGIEVSDISYRPNKEDSYDQYYDLPRIKFVGKLADEWPEVIGGVLNRHWWADYGAHLRAAPFLLSESAVERLESHDLQGFKRHPVELLSLKRAQRDSAPSYFMLSVPRASSVKEIYSWSGSSKEGYNLLGRFDPKDASYQEMARKPKLVTAGSIAQLSDQALPDLFFLRDRDERGDSISCSAAFIEAIQKSQIRGFVVKRMDDPGRPELIDLLDLDLPIKKHPQL